MRLDELPRSDNIEDRRGETGSARSGIPGGRGGLGIGTIVVLGLIGWALGIDPKQAQGYVVPDAFTHGSSQQRTQWFTAGLKSGALSSCDTFATTQQLPSARN